MQNMPKLPRAIGDKHVSAFKKAGWKNKKTKVFVTGGTGFVGKYVIEELLKNGFKLKCLVRLGSEKKLSKYKNIEITMGDITDYESLLNGMEECSAVINQGRYCGGAYSNKRINN